VLLFDSIQFPMTTNFYAPPSAFRGSRVVLPEDEARHVQAVLRAQAGDEIVVVDGVGGWHRVTLDHLDSDQVVGTVQETRRDVGEPAVHLTVGMGLITTRSRFETFVEKAVELGVCRIVPLHTQHTETDTLRHERTRNVMIAALKQCRRSRLPALAEPQPIDSVLDAADADARLLCHGGAEGPPLGRAVEDVQAGDRVLAMVGPEGGFADDEVRAAEAAGFTTVSLGRRRLRAETAGIVVTTAVSMRRRRGAETE
jgi:16S rRNA (uracil1498-N3)-methyltransferase